MKSFLQLPLIKSVHQRHLLLPVLVGAAVLGVLLHGAFSRQDAAEASDAPLLQLPAPPSLPDLRPRLEKTPLTYLSDYYLQLGEQAKNKFVLIGQAKQPGLVVTPGVILTSLRVADDSIRPGPPEPADSASEPADNAPATKNASAGEDTPEQEQGADEAEHTLVADVAGAESNQPSRPMPLSAVDPELGIALFEMEQPYIASPFSVADPSTLPAGSVVLAVTLLPDGSLEIIPGILASPGPQLPEDADRLHVSVLFPAPPAVAAIVDLDGRFVGAAVESDGGVRFLSSNRVLRAVDGLRAGEPCRAIQVSDLSETARQVMQVPAGILVEKVMDDAFVPEPSIRPGDIVVQWDGQDISAAEEFHSLYDQKRGELVRYRALRDQRMVSGATVVPDSSCRPIRHPALSFPGLGLTLRWIGAPGDAENDIEHGWKVLRVEAENIASRAGVRAGDRILALNGKSLTETDGEQRLRAAAEQKPFVITLRRGDRVQLASVEPEPE